ncbi:MAG: helix-turn-helix transcriptional regulator [Pseudomonadota bacterium]
MTSDASNLLREIVCIHGQAAVARALGYSPSAVNQALKGTYGAGLENILQAVVDAYGRGSVACPVMGEIPIRRCAEERKKPFAASSPQRARLFMACQQCTRHRI